MKKSKIVILSAFLLLFLSLALSGENIKSAEDILKDFVLSYQEKAPADESEIFGIQITGEKGGEWHIRIEPGKKVFLAKGKAPLPTFYFTMDFTTLKKIHYGEMNILTAMGRARASDPAPADIKFTEGFIPTPALLAKVLPLIFHFFTLGSPEIVHYGEPYSRSVHGGNMVIFYYEKGLRTAWAQVKKGMVVNQDLKDQTNPFPTLVIAIKGKARLGVGEKIYTLEAGTAIFIPAGMPHQFWNEEEEPAECILIMFGKEA